MRSYYLFEIEGNGRPILKTGEWEHLENLTSDKENTTSINVFGYGEIEEDQFIELFEK
ncbi:hypothetical protein ACDX77_19055 [Bacillus velezensis]|uniref:hypothetical protein n=1 Tax=Bacillus velezensis TaxID=492670 RepID=UPI003558BD75